jgi:hypothetical protein
LRYILIDSTNKWKFKYQTNGIKWRNDPFRSRDIFVNLNSAWMEDCNCFFFQYPQRCGTLTNTRLNSIWFRKLISKIINHVYNLQIRILAVHADRNRIFFSKLWLLSNDRLRKWSIREQKFSSSLFSSAAMRQLFEVRRRDSPNSDALIPSS